MDTSQQQLSDNAQPPEPVTLAQAFWYWLKLGFISFGGPAGQIAIMHQDLVEKKRWISERRFLHALNYCMVLPGPEAQQLAVYIGWLMHRTWGGIIAGSLFVLPSLFILIFLSWIYLAFGNVPAVAGILYGIKPAVTAIVLFAAYRIGSRALKNGVLWTIAAAAFFAIFAFDVPFPAIVLAAGLIGYVGGRVAPDKFATGGGHGKAKDRVRPPGMTPWTQPGSVTRSRRGAALPAARRRTSVPSAVWKRSTSIASRYSCSTRTTPSSVPRCSPSMSSGAWPATGST